MRVIILRHGETQSNVEKRIQGHADTKLNAHGEEQAEAVAKILAEKEKIDAVYSSPLSRAFQTAEIIAGDKLDVIPFDGLKERGMGPIEGMLHKDAVEKRKIDGLPSLLSYGEDSKSLSRRVQKAYKTIIEEAEAKGYKTIVLVSHGSSLYHLFEKLIHTCRCETPELRKRVLSRPKIGNCCVTIIQDGKFQCFAEQWTHSIVRERDLV